MTNQELGVMERYVGNAIRTLYQMIILVEESSSLCTVLDHNKEISTVSVHDDDYFSSLCDSMLRNIHPEDREEFTSFFAKGKPYLQLFFL